MIDETYPSVRVARALEVKQDFSICILETPPGEPTPRTTARPHLVISETPKSSNQLPSSSSRLGVSVCDLSILLGDTIHPIQNVTKVNHNDGASKINESGILGWLISVGRKLLRSFKSCYKTMPMA